eukprot:TRINITY_DN1142_c0_g1_i2.p1 TRINITY_DN1142_c0_g1~~TRINITY_DN1142_c0_g1_i2.p1  ORF type:complete len:132 (+),score=20.07 TRINITY_DN1142_c0_g1_i2:48-443(+)
MSEGLFLDPLGRSTASRDYGSADRETTSRASQVTLGLSTNLHLFANEPSLALYRLEEHVRKSVPKLVKVKHQVASQSQELDGTVQDTHYAIESLRPMEHLTKIDDLERLVTQALRLQEQLNSKVKPDKSGN